MKDTIKQFLCNRAAFAKANFGEVAFWVTPCAAVAYAVGRYAT